MNFLTNITRIKFVPFSLIFKRSVKKGVVVTGLGVVCSVGCNVSTAWQNILNGVSGIKKLGSEYDEIPCRVGALVDETKIINFDMINNLKIASKATKYLLIAAAEALADAQIDLQDSVELESTGVCISTAFSNFSDTAKSCEDFMTNGYENFDPFAIARGLVHLPAVLISNKYKFRGPMLSQTCGNVTGLVAIGEAYHYIKYHPNIEIMVCGSTEACISPFSLAGFCQLNFLSTKYNDTPEKACRPFDKDRDGVVIGEGAGVLILESLEHALNRRALIYCEILGYGTSVNNSSLFDKRIDDKRDTVSIMESMSLALLDAKVHPDAVSYVNANGSSSISGDYAEAIAIQELFGDRSWELFVSSTKGAHGNLMGGASSVETVFTCMAIFDGKLPPTLNNDMDKSEFHLNFVTELDTDYYSRRKIALKNATSITGLSACLCLSYFNPLKLI